VAGLHYVSDAEPGIVRRGTSPFRYVDERLHRPLRDRVALERIRALAVPPAWTGYGGSVAAVPDSLADLAATARSGIKGRSEMNRAQLEGPVGRSWMPTPKQTAAAGAIVVGRVASEGPVIVKGPR
jgi:hypothetical protein